MAIEAVLQEALKMSTDERVELVERLIDAIDEQQVDLSARELVRLDEALADADRAIQHGTMIPADDVLARMRKIS